MPNEVERFIFAVGGRLKPEDFAFTVEAEGVGRWDVYRFFARGREGMLAWRKMESHCEIGFFRAGTHTKEEILEALRKGKNGVT